MTLFLCGKAGQVFIGKTAANFLPGHDNMFKIFNDRGSKDEFEGFDPEDVVQPQFNGLSIGVYSVLFSSRKTVLWIFSSVICRDCKTVLFNHIKDSYLCI